MKTIRTMLITFVLVALASSAFAAGSATLTINANVLGTCDFSAAGATMDFLNIDPTAVVDATASTSIDYSCTSGVVYTFTNPANTSITNGTDTMAVDLVYSTAGGTGTGVAETLTIDGTITVASFTGVTAGAYTGTATLNINP
jgi:hypothetical protein